MENSRVERFKNSRNRRKIDGMITRVELTLRVSIRADMLIRAVLLAEAIGGLIGLFVPIPATAFVLLRVCLILDVSVLVCYIVRAVLEQKNYPQLSSKTTIPMLIFIAMVVLNTFFLLSRQL